MQINKNNQKEKVVATKIPEEDLEHPTDNSCHRTVMVVAVGPPFSDLPSYFLAFFGLLHKSSSNRNKTTIVLWK